MLRVYEKLAQLSINQFERSLRKYTRLRVQISIENLKMPKEFGLEFKVNNGNTSLQVRRQLLDIV